MERVDLDRHTACLNQTKKEPRRATLYFGTRPLSALSDIKVVLLWIFQWLRKSCATRRESYCECPLVASGSGQTQANFPLISPWRRLALMFSYFENNIQQTINKLEVGVRFSQQIIYGLLDAHLRADKHYR